MLWDIFVAFVCYTTFTSSNYWLGVEIAVVPISKRISVDRALSSEETALVGWLLENGNESSRRVLPQLHRARVSSLCGCGCASIDFAIQGAPEPADAHGMEVVSDYWWRTDGGNRCGAFVFLRGGLLAGLDLWSIDGVETPGVLPRVNQLRSYAEHFDS